MTTKEIVDNFVSQINIENTYTSAELVSLLKNAIKNGGKPVKSGGKRKTTAKNDDGEVKQPKALSAYNLFIRAKMQELKDVEMSPKDRLIAATTAWNLEKAKKLNGGDVSVSKE